MTSDPRGRGSPSIDIVVGDGGGTDGLDHPSVLKVGGQGKNGGECGEGLDTPGCRSGFRVKVARVASGQ